jgi:hypothetical protein
MDAFMMEKTTAQLYRESEFFREKSRADVMEWLKVKYEKGFRYVVRDEENNNNLGAWLVIFSMKPKRYMDDGCWGYREKDFDDIELMPADIIKNTDMPEISWNNRSATDIEKLLAKWGKADDGTR